MNREEHEIQTAFVAWCEYHSETRGVYAIPNGGNRPKKMGRGGGMYSPEGVRLKAEGVKPGMPDLVFPDARLGYNHLYIEVKKPGGTVDPEQKKRHAELRERGNLVVVCYSFSECVLAAMDYYGITDVMDRGVHEREVQRMKTQPQVKVKRAPSKKINPIP